jgi:hypothetical protein
MFVFIRRSSGYTARSTFKLIIVLVSVPGSESSPTISVPVIAVAQRQADGNTRQRQTPRERKLIGRLKTGLARLNEAHGLCIQQTRAYHLESVVSIVKTEQ